MGDESCYFVPINSATLEDVRHSDTELNGGPRPQSVQSISTNQSTTPVPPSASCDELRYRVDAQSKNMQALKEQQAHLLRLQQAARQQLQEMETMRQMHTASVAPPVESFETVEQVQDGIGSIMERMRVLSTFIHNQQELSNMLGTDNDDVLADQAALQQKFQELRDKKSQMHSLVSELQSLNMDASRQFDGSGDQAGGGEVRNVPIELTHAPATAAEARNATKTFLSGAGDGLATASSKVAPGTGVGLVSNGGPVNGNGAVFEADEEEDDEGPLNEEESAVLNGTADMLSEKINEINAMKSQLRRLKEMMDTVKLIEMKTGHAELIDEEEEDDEEDAPEEDEDGAEDEDEAEAGQALAAAVASLQQEQQRRSRSRSVSSAPIAAFANPPPLMRPEEESEMSNQEREQLNKRVEALQAMTQDLREQAKSIAAERDRLKHAQNDLQKRRNNVANLQQQAANEKLTNHVASFSSLLQAGGSANGGGASRQQGLPPGPKERRQMELKAELEQKRRELERIENMTQNIKKNAECMSSRSGQVAEAGAGEAASLAAVSSSDLATNGLSGVAVDPSNSSVKAEGPPSIVSSSVESCSGSHHRGTPSVPSIPPPPAPSAISGSLQNNTAGSNATNDSKTNSADSGVTSDIFAHAQLESAASYQSSSTRSFPPPMPDICNRNAATDRYRQAKRAADGVDGERAGSVGGPGGVLDAGGISGAAGGPTSAGERVMRDSRTSPWPVFGNGTGAGMSSSNTGPHSPHYGHHHHHHAYDLPSLHGVSAGGYGGTGAYGSSWSTGGGPFGTSNLLPPLATTPNTPPDPIVFQHIMQTQQMLMNSITQCNQLLWIQQREIHNLNNAVLMLQERILGTNNSLLMQEPHAPTVAAAAALIRAESTPPTGSMNASTTATNAGGSLFARARSEQPTSIAQQHHHHQQQQLQQQSSSSPFHHPHAPYQPPSGTGGGVLPQQHMSHQPGPSFASQPYSPLAMPQTHSMLSPQHCSIAQQQQAAGNQRNNTNSSQIGHLPPSGMAGRYHRSTSTSRPPLNINTLNNALYDEQAPPPPGNDSSGEYDLTNAAPHMINNLSAAMPAHNPSQSSPGTSLRFGNYLNNLNNSVTNNLTNVSSNAAASAIQQNNLNLYNHQQQPQHGQDGSATSAQQQQQQQTQALNNQVLPGVRANNYWDNFRSYSRQNLLSSNSCKSNEESCAYAGNGGSGGIGGASGSASGGQPVVGSGGAGVTASTASGTGSSGCNTINNQLQRNNSNAANQFMNNQNNKYQTINITRNNSLSNANQDIGVATPQMMGYHQHQQPQQQQEQERDPAFDGLEPSTMHHHHTHHHQLQHGGGGVAEQQQSYLSHHPHQQQQPQQHRQQPLPFNQQPPNQHLPLQLPMQPDHGQLQQQQVQQAQSHHTAALNQSQSFDLGELQFHTNPINLGLANKMQPKASGHKKYPLSLRSCRDASVGGESSGGCYVSGGGDMNLATACTYQHDSKSTSKLFEALKENVYQEVKNLITANESRPHFLIQLFRELQLISSDPLRQRTLQSIQELYNRYIESTLQEENHVNNVGSNNLLTSSSVPAGDGDIPLPSTSADTSGAVGRRTNESHPVEGPLVADSSSTVELEVVQNYTNLRQQQQQQQQQQQYHYVANMPDSAAASGSQSTGEVSSADVKPSTTVNSSASVTGRQEQPLGTLATASQQPPLSVSNSEIINIIMGDIVAVINSVDYINDSVLFKIAGVICNHAASGSHHRASCSNLVEFVEGTSTLQQHHHHHHHQHHYHHHVPMATGSGTSRQPSASSSSVAAASSLLTAASFLSAAPQSESDPSSAHSAQQQQQQQHSGDSFNREDFLRHLESWNRTDKDEFISNLENFLNNILLRSSSAAVIVGDCGGSGVVCEEEEEVEEDAHEAAGLTIRAAGLSSGDVSAGAGYDGAFVAGLQPEDDNVDQPTFNGNTESSASVAASGAAAIVSSSTVNSYASTTYDLAEADQVCDLSANGVAEPAPIITPAPVEPSSSTFDDRWTVTVQRKKSIDRSKEDEASASVGAGACSSSVAGGDSWQRIGGMMMHRHLHHLHHQQQQQQQDSVGLSEMSDGEGNNGNNANNNWQSEEWADEDME
ncbi:uncharacterized protein LOC126573976 isoform X2 [Anopheles aquasalis]|uniref:uncharacterized protein LOC126573976 isoform X2 n=1 Tax=Anopheles aquasalis TaxID=42839 RepID=UPI00215A86F2|nr:uncharacterized protein LOC126573976 isoform X2 [Anopheles aquasalis]